MDSGTATVLAAIVTVVGGLLAIMVQSFRSENQKDHAEVITELRWLRRIVERVETKYDNHVIDYHGGENERKSSRKRSEKEPKEIQSDSNN